MTSPSGRGCRARCRCPSCRSPPARARPELDVPVPGLDPQGLPQRRLVLRDRRLVLGDLLLVRRDRLEGGLAGGLAGLGAGVGAGALVLGLDQVGLLLVLVRRQGRLVLGQGGLVLRDGGALAAAGVRGSRRRGRRRGRRLGRRRRRRSPTRSPRPRRAWPGRRRASTRPRRRPRSSAVVWSVPNVWPAVTCWPGVTATVATWPATWNEAAASLTGSTLPTTVMDVPMSALVTVASR